jgi:hypothetical protein
MLLFTAADGAVELAPELLADVEGDVLVAGCDADCDGAVVGPGELGVDARGSLAVASPPGLRKSA